MAFQGVQLLQLPVFGVTVLPAPVLVALTILIVLISTNAVNFIDGLDGLAAGVVGIAALAFFAYTYLLSKTYDPPNVFSSATFITAALVGCCVGFLPHNFHPARLFMGDAGALLLGLLLAAATISITGSIDPSTSVSGNSAVAIFLPVVVPLAILTLPLLDVLLAVIRRTAGRAAAVAAGRRAPAPPDAQDRAHPPAGGAPALPVGRAARHGCGLLRLRRRLAADRGHRRAHRCGHRADRVAAQVETADPLVIPFTSSHRKPTDFRNARYAPSRDAPTTPTIRQDPP